MNIAYLVLTHNQPQHLQRMIDALTYRQNHFFIHVDKRASMAQFEAIRQANVHFCTQRVRCSWADYSLVEATLTLMREASASGMHFDYFILLSGACYPLKSNAYIERFLEAGQGTQYIEAFGFPDSAYGKADVRLAKYWVRRTHPWRNLKCRVQSLILKYAPPRDYRKALDGFAAYAGSQWWGLTGEAVAYCLEYVARHPAYTALYASSDCPDESFFQTLMMNSRFSDRVSHKLVYTEWREGEWSPSLMTMAHLPQLQAPVVLDAANNNSPQPKREVLFARKFGDGSAELLDRLDALRSLEAARGSAQAPAAARRRT